ncbi:MAG: hypothetical protein PVI30_09510 [Myxococcales bacterium]|jgi:hypothetical protein
MHVTVIGGDEHGPSRVLVRHGGVRLKAEAQAGPMADRHGLVQAAQMPQSGGAGLPAWLCHGGCVACCVLMLPVLTMTLFYAVVIIAVAGPFVLPLFAVPLWGWLSRRRARTGGAQPAQPPQPQPTLAIE